MNQHRASLFLCLKLIQIVLHIVSFWVKLLKLRQPMIFIQQQLLLGLHRYVTFVTENKHDNPTFVLMLDQYKYELYQAYNK